MVQHQAISEKEPMRHSHFNRYEYDVTDTLMYTGKNIYFCAKCAT